MTSQNLSHFYISKKPLLLVFQSSTNLPKFRLPAPIGQKFDMVSRIFLKYKNGSNFFYDLLRPFPIHTVLPHIFKKNVITLLCKLKNVFMEHNQFVNKIALELVWKKTSHKHSLCVTTTIKKGRNKRKRPCRKGLLAKEVPLIEKCRAKETLWLTGW